MVEKIRLKFEAINVWIIIGQKERRMFCLMATHNIDPWIVLIPEEISLSREQA